MQDRDEKILEDNRIVIKEAIETQLIEKDRNYNTISELLPTLFQSKKLTLDLSVYKPTNAAEPSAIGKYLIYDSPNKEEPLSIWIFAIGYQQKTCIHDHKYRGTVMILSEAVSEKYYRPNSDTTATRVKRVDRLRFHTSRDDLINEPTIVHQLKRRKGLGEGVSSTLHIYEMSANIIKQQETVEQNRNVSTIYEKSTPSSDHSEYQQLRF